MHNLKKSKKWLKHNPKNDDELRLTGRQIKLKCGVKTNKIILEIYLYAFII